MNDAKPAKNASGIRPATGSASKRASSSSTRRSSVRIERRAAGGRGSRPRLHLHTAAPSPTAPPSTATSGNSHASRSNPCFDGRARPQARTVAIELLLDLRSRVARRDAPRDERLHPQRDRRRSTGRVSCGRSGRSPRPRARPAWDAARSRPPRAHASASSNAASSLSRRARPGCPAAVSPSSRRPARARRPCRCGRRRTSRARR